MAKRRNRDEPRLDETMGQGVGHEPQPSNALPEAVVGQTDQPRQGLGQPDESGHGSGLGIGKVQDGQPMGGTVPEHSGQQAGRARNGRGADRMARESIVDRDTEDRGAEDIVDRDTEDFEDRGAADMVDRDTAIRRETDVHNATGEPFDSESAGRKVTREDDIFGREGES